MSDSTHLRKAIPVWMRATALVTALIFVSDSVLLAGSVDANASIRVPAPNLSAHAIQISDALGHIQEVYEAKPDAPLVVLIQDAHAVPEAQRNIQRIIDSLKATYGISLIAAEGSRSAWDAQLLQSFPDQEKLEKVIDAYYQKGEMNGAVASAIFSKTRSLYHGIEDWTLYEEGLGFYLEAMENETLLAEEWNAQQKTLEKRKEDHYSKALLEVDRHVEAFLDTHEDIESLLKVLLKHRKPEAGSALEAILQELMQAPDIQIDVEIQKLVKELDPKNHSQEFNRKHQDYLTSQISAAEFAHRIQETYPDLSISEALKDLIHHQERLQRIEGSPLFLELERYIAQVKGKLFETEEQQQVDQDTKRQRTLKQLRQLELNRSQWESLEGVTDLFRAHRNFYQNAQKREDAFLRNLSHLTKGTEPAILIAGGFHAGGLTKRLREMGTSYVLLTPEISELPEHIRYRAQMQGDVSWKDYFEFKNGKMQLYDAFMRAVRDGLLENEGPWLKKIWRDNLLRDLADQNRIHQAKGYTRFLDELSQGASPKFQDPDLSWLDRVDTFIEGLRQLDATNQISPSNILNLLQPATFAVPATSAALEVRSEVRAEFSSGKKQPKTVHKTQPLTLKIGDVLEINTGLTLTVQDVGTQGNFLSLMPNDGSNKPKTLSVSKAFVEMKPPISIRLDVIRNNKAKVIVKLPTHMTVTKTRSEARRPNTKPLENLDQWRLSELKKRFLEIENEIEALSPVTEESIRQGEQRNRRMIAYASFDAILLVSSFSMLVLTIAGLFNVGIVFNIAFVAIAVASVIRAIRHLKWGGSVARNNRARIRKLNELNVQYTRIGQELLERGEFPRRSEARATTEELQAALKERYPTLYVPQVYGPAQTWAQRSLADVLGDRLASNRGKGQIEAKKIAGRVFRRTESLIFKVSKMPITLRMIESADEDELLREIDIAGELEESLPGFPQIQQVGILEVPPRFRIGQPQKYLWAEIKVLPNRIPITEVPFSDPQSLLQTFHRLGLKLHEMHSENIAHNDITPSNLFRDAEGNIQVGDFGLSRYLGEPSTGGTPGFLPWSRDPDRPNIENSWPKVAGPQKDLYGFVMTMIYKLHEAVLSDRYSYEMRHQFQMIRNDLMDLVFIDWGENLFAMNDSAHRLPLTLTEYIGHGLLLLKDPIIEAPQTMENALRVLEERMSALQPREIPKLHPTETHAGILKEIISILEERAAGRIRVSMNRRDALRRTALSRGPEPDSEDPFHLLQGRLFQNDFEEVFQQTDITRLAVIEELETIRQKPRSESRAQEKKLSSEIVKGILLGAVALGAFWLGAWYFGGAPRKDWVQEFNEMTRLVQDAETPESLFEIIEDRSLNSIHRHQAVRRAAKMLEGENNTHSKRFIELLVGELEDFLNNDLDNKTRVDSWNVRHAAIDVFMEREEKELLPLMERIVQEVDEDKSLHQKALEALKVLSRSEARSAQEQKQIEMQRDLDFAEAVLALDLEDDEDHQVFYYLRLGLNQIDLPSNTSIYTWDHQVPKESPYTQILKHFFHEKDTAGDVEALYLLRGMIFDKSPKIAHEFFKMLLRTDSESDKLINPVLVRALRLITTTPESIFIEYVTEAVDDRQQMGPAYYIRSYGQQTTPHQEPLLRQDRNRLHPSYWQRSESRGPVEDSHKINSSLRHIQEFFNGYSFGKFMTESHVTPSQLLYHFMIDDALQVMVQLSSKATQADAVLAEAALAFESNRWSLGWIDIVPAFNEVGEAVLLIPEVQVDRAYWTLLDRHKRRLKKWHKHLIQKLEESKEVLGVKEILKVSNDAMRANDVQSGLIDFHAHYDSMIDEFYSAPGPDYEKQDRTLRFKENQKELTLNVWVKKKAEERSEVRTITRGSSDFFEMGLDPDSNWMPETKPYSRTYLNPFLETIRQKVARAKRGKGIREQAQKILAHLEQLIGSQGDKAQNVYAFDEIRMLLPGQDEATNRVAFSYKLGEIEPNRILIGNGFFDVDHNLGAQSLFVAAMQSYFKTVESKQVATPSKDHADVIAEGVFGSDAKTKFFETYHDFTSLDSDRFLFSAVDRFHYFDQESPQFQTHQLFKEWLEHDTKGRQHPVLAQAAFLAKDLWTRKDIIVSDARNHNIIQSEWMVKIKTVVTEDRAEAEHYWRGLFKIIFPLIIFSYYRRDFIVSYDEIYKSLLHQANIIRDEHGADIIRVKPELASAMKARDDEAADDKIVNALFEAAPLKMTSGKSMALVMSGPEPASAEAYDHISDRHTRLVRLAGKGGRAWRDSRLDFYVTKPVQQDDEDNGADPIWLEGAGLVPFQEIAQFVLFASGYPFYEGLVVHHQNQIVSGVAASTLGKASRDWSDEENSLRLITVDQIYMAKQQPAMRRIFYDFDETDDRLTIQRYTQGIWADLFMWLHEDQTVPTASMSVYQQESVGLLKALTQLRSGISKRIQDRKSRLAANGGRPMTVIDFNQLPFSQNRARAEGMLDDFVRDITQVKPQTPKPTKESYFRPDGVDMNPWIERLLELQEKFEYVFWSQVRQRYPGGYDGLLKDIQDDDRKRIPTTFWLYVLFTHPQSPLAELARNLKQEGESNVLTEEAALEFLDILMAVYWSGVPRLYRDEGMNPLTHKIFSYVHLHPDNISVPDMQGFQKFLTEYLPLDDRDREPAMSFQDWVEQFSKDYPEVREPSDNAPVLPEYRLDPEADGAFALNRSPSDIFAPQPFPVEDLLYPERHPWQEVEGREAVWVGTYAEEGLRIPGTDYAFRIPKVKPGALLRVIVFENKLLVEPVNPATAFRSEARAKDAGSENTEEPLVDLELAADPLIVLHLDVAREPFGIASHTGDYKWSKVPVADETELREAPLEGQTLKQHEFYKIPAKRDGLILFSFGGVIRAVSVPRLAEGDSVIIHNTDRRIVVYDQNYDYLGTFMIDREDHKLTLINPEPGFGLLPKLAPSVAHLVGHIDAEDYQSLNQLAEVLQTMLGRGRGYTRIDLVEEGPEVTLDIAGGVVHVSREFLHDTSGTRPTKFIEVLEEQDPLLKLEALRDQFEALAKSEEAFEIDIVDLAVLSREFKHIAIRLRGVSLSAWPDATRERYQTMQRETHELYSNIMVMRSIDRYRQKNAKHLSPKMRATKPVRSLLLRVFEDYRKNHRDGSSGFLFIKRGEGARGGVGTYTGIGSLDLDEKKTIEGIGILTSEYIDYSKDNETQISDFIIKHTPGKGDVPFVVLRYMKKVRYKTVRGGRDAEKERPVLVVFDLRNGQVRNDEEVEHQTLQQAILDKKARILEDAERYKSRLRDELPELLEEFLGRFVRDKGMTENELMAIQNEVLGALVQLLPSALNTRDYSVEINHAVLLIIFEEILREGIGKAASRANIFQTHMATQVSTEQITLLLYLEDALRSNKNKFDFDFDEYTSLDQTLTAEQITNFREFVENIFLYPLRHSKKEALIREENRKKVIREEVWVQEILTQAANVRDQLHSLLRFRPTVVSEDGTTWLEPQAARNRGFKSAEDNKLEPTIQEQYFIRRYFIKKNAEDAQRAREIEARKKREAAEAARRIALEGDENYQRKKRFSQLQANNDQFEAYGGVTKVGASSLRFWHDRADGKRTAVMVDAGQTTSRPPQAANFPNFKNRPAQDSPEAIFLTHTHMDHVGGIIPLLENLRAQAPVFVPKDSKKLLYLVLRNGYRKMTRQYRRLEREGTVDESDYRRYVLYSIEELDALMANVRELEYNEWYQIDEEVKVRFHGPVGHLHGAASVIISTPNGNTFISGDISKRQQGVVPGFRNWPKDIPIHTAFMESTFGMRERTLEADQENEVAAKVVETLKRGGKVIIPATANGGAQSVLDIVLQNLDQLPDELQERVKIVVDGEASEMTELYQEFYEQLADPRVETMDLSLGGEELDIERYAILNRSDPTIVIASSGDANYGTSSFYARNALSDKRNALIFTGFIKKKSAGYELLNKKRGEFYSFSDGDPRSYEVNAEIVHYNLLDHASGPQILEILQSMDIKKSLRRVYFVHGSREPRIEMIGAFRRQFHRDIADVFSPEDTNLRMSPFDAIEQYEAQRALFESYEATPISNVEPQEIDTRPRKRPKKPARSATPLSVAEKKEGKPELPELKFGTGSRKDNLTMESRRALLKLALEKNPELTAKQGMEAIREMMMEAGYARHQAIVGETTVRRDLKELRSEVRLKEEDLAILFNATGFQFPRMGEDLYATYPDVRSMYERANRETRRILKDPSFDVTKISFHSTNHEFGLDENIVAVHVAIVVHQIALWEVLQKWFQEKHGYKLAVGAIVGASRGSSAAYYAAGAMTLEQAVELSIRSTQFIKASADLQDRRRMAVVKGLDQSTVERILAEGRYDAAIAARLYKRRFVISAPEASMDSIAADIRTFDKQNARFARPYPAIVATNHDPKLVNLKDRDVKKLAAEYRMFLKDLRQRIQKPTQRLGSIMTPGKILETPQDIIDEEWTTLTNMMPIDTAMGALQEKFNIDRFVELGKPLKDPILQRQIEEGTLTSTTQHFFAAMDWQLHKLVAVDLLRSEAREGGREHHALRGFVSRQDGLYENDEVKQLVATFKQYEEAQADYAAQVNRYNTAEKGLPSPSDELFRKFEVPLRQSEKQRDEALLAFARAVEEPIRSENGVISSSAFLVVSSDLNALVQVLRDRITELQAPNSIVQRIRHQRYSSKPYFPKYSGTDLTHHFRTVTPLFLNLKRRFQEHLYRRSESRRTAETFMDQIRYGNVARSELRIAAGKVNDIVSVEDVVKDLEHLKEEVRNDAVSSTDLPVNPKLVESEIDILIAALTQILDGGHAVGYHLPAIQNRARERDIISSLERFETSDQILFGGKVSELLRRDLRSLGKTARPLDARSGRSLVLPGDGQKYAGLISIEDAAFKAAKNLVPITATSAEALDPFTAKYLTVLQTAIALLLAHKVKDAISLQRLLLNPAALLKDYNLVPTFESRILGADGQGLRISTVAVQAYLQWRASQEFQAAA